ncbi:MAG: cobalamin biosynthesis protein CbiD [Anaerocolumna sp.]|jgi:cobalt-precorrin-5B (C1)-methyltransferase|nr:cobalamin biosynthesis protein CbiD [Anaerocolumna sp.]
MEDHFIYKGNKKLRCGYTTGSCAAAAAKAATIMILSNGNVTRVNIQTPKGIELSLEIKEISRDSGRVTCAVQKDSGDDVDVTNHMLVFATVRKIPEDIIVDGGHGIGRVTKPGLSQEIGEAAINKVPKEMIINEVRKACYEAEYSGGIEVIISIPRGEEIARKTFNPRLGIVGGLSILGTSGIVEPMSEKALIDTIRTEIKMISAAGISYLPVSPGNYGEAFAGSSLSINQEQIVKCSNFIGETIDMAYEFKLKGMLFIGHIGKLVKLGGGIMNTHSKYADCRQEILCSCALLAGGGTEVLKEILQCITTDEALTILKREGLFEETMSILMEKIDFHLQTRACDGLKIGAIVFSNVHGMIGKTKDVEELITHVT